MDFNLLEYISIKYIIIVLCVVETIKIYIPAVTKASNNKKLVTVGASIIVAFGFIVANLFYENPEPIGVYHSKLFVSFLVLLAFYDYLVKPIVDRIKGTPKPPNDADV